MKDKLRSHTMSTVTHLDPDEIKRLTSPSITREKIHSLLDFKPRNLDLYRQALIHKSVLRLTKFLPPQQVPKYMIESNERLEFLGDAILSCITADYLYKKFPDEDEGFLTRVRSKLVDTKALSTFAKKLGLGNYVIMSRHLQSLDGRNREKMHENVFEAWVGAIYLDTNLEYARKFILNVFNTLVDWDAVLMDTNYKDQMLKYCQMNKMAHPEYVVLRSIGPPHNRTYEVALKVGGKTLGTGIKQQKKGAEQQAAFESLRSLKYKGKQMGSKNSVYNRP